MNVVVKFDGACSMKRSIAAGAAIVYTDDGVELGRRGMPIPGGTTPQAEYTGLIVGLQLAHELGAKHVKAWGDAELIVRHVDGRYRCKKPELKRMLDQVLRLQACFESCVVLELPRSGPLNKRRHMNNDADALAGMVKETGIPIYQRS